MKFNNDFFTVLRKLHKDPNASQRRIAEELNLSLGKINYCIKALKNKGLIKVKNFKDSKDKVIQLIKELDWQNGYYRRDIGFKVIT